MASGRDDQAARAPTDESLMQRVASGDTAAFELLFVRYESPLLRYFRRSVRDYAAAEELAAESFLNLFRSRDRYDVGRPVRPFLYGIARNCLLKYFERMKRAAAPAEAAGEPSEAVDPADSAERSQRHELLRRAVAELPEQFREAVVLCYFEDLKPSEAAEVLGVPAATVRTRLARGLEQLRRKLSG
jgi:RNA polymerase sigma-70 factor (ECF subfamily)